MAAPEFFRRVGIAQGNRAGLADTSDAPAGGAQCYPAAMLRLPGAPLAAASLLSRSAPPGHDARPVLRRFRMLSDLE